MFACKKLSLSFYSTNASRQTISILFEKEKLCLTNFHQLIQHKFNNYSTKSTGLVQNAAVIFAAIPSSYPEAGKHIRYVKNRTINVDCVNTQGGIVTKNLAISIDPYMRGRMRPIGTKSYVEAFELNQPLTNFFVGKIVKSDNDRYNAGQFVYGQGAYEEYTVHSKDQTESLRILSDEELKLDLPLTTWVGAAGMSGQTAFYGLYHIGKPKKDETIFITGASGAVGQIVGQLAKREGLKVIGSAGTDDKVEWLQKELCFDHAFNYKTANVKAELAKFGSLNIYFDNVGGEQLEAALDAAADHARFVECGMISQFHKSNDSGIRNLILVVRKRLTLQGFIILDQANDENFNREFYSKVPKWIANGDLKVKEDVTKGLEKAPEAIVGIFKGKNFGKAAIKIADD
ncbi:unnamed protein product [Rotaria magnacalcarata]|uniref:15-oxoprostaglandin 13-reductase n=1 Tax=Rotaria magnacalcarata TaxID=392030 RepID=A0A816KTT1_9BILA|nr:unnamed protein product [Rotaria magnacalcarata]CAF1686315.1 unnamed protein product [Rotaria magnacalcarata]CAF1926011.1 unnamed protein product [Rotaria magnacalcarata]CAF1974408.1 unnamed protein product [Rotaria magnacalcarata]CAF2117550.1 unnamed protein product [Rotaria magnacalcarata]